MLALFAPSRPFMRLDINQEWLEQNPQDEQSTLDNEEGLSKMERMATRELDTIPGARAAFYQAMTNLIVLGNCIIYLPQKRYATPRVYGINSYVLRRTGTGEVKTLIIKEDLLFDELEEEVQEAALAGGTKEYQPTSKVKYYKKFDLTEDGHYDLCQYVDKVKLPKEFNGSWTAENMPYRVLVWNLKEGNHYGTGLVEDYSSDFAGLSSLSQALIEGAILASEYRFLVDTGGATKVEDIENSANGSAIPGREGDISILSSAKSTDLKIVQEVAQEYIQRIGRGFLLGSAVTRDAERVTAQEIRQQAQELETSLGGVYSRIAVDLQLPVARWLLKQIKVTLKNSQIKLSIVTGLDALSRGGDLDSLRSAINDGLIVSQSAQALPELKRGAVMSDIFTGHGLEAKRYIFTDAEVRQQQKEAQAQMQEQETMAAATQAGVESAVNPKQQGTR